MVRQQRRKYSVNGQGRALEGEENNKGFGEARILRGLGGNSHETEDDGYGGEVWPPYGG